MVEQFRGYCLDKIKYMDRTTDRWSDSNIPPCNFVCLFGILIFTLIKAPCMCQTRMKENRGTMMYAHSLMPELQAKEKGKSWFLTLPHLVRSSMSTSMESCSMCRSSRSISRWTSSSFRPEKNIIHFLEAINSAWLIKVTWYIARDMTDAWITCNSNLVIFIIFLGRGREGGMGRGWSGALLL